MDASAALHTETSHARTDRYRAGALEPTTERELPYPVFFPGSGLSTDNAAMIAAAAFPKLARGEFADATLRAKANLALA